MARAAANATLTPLWPWFGAKRKAAHEIWARFGNPTTYVEPFAGSAAVLLARPNEHRWWDSRKFETINDADGHISNTFRALAADAEAVIAHADWPINEADLTARHLWLTQHRESLTSRLMADPDFYDARAAGWWLWGICAWVGGDWCTGAGPYTGSDAVSITRGGTTPGVYRKMPMISGSHGGRGIHRPPAWPATPDEVPDVTGAMRDALTKDITAISNRLRRVRVACGDWSRVLNNAAKPPAGRTAAILLDPPYDPNERRGDLYAVGDRPENRPHAVHAAARAWALEHGDEPSYRIAYCSYSTDAEDRQFTSAGWTSYRWSALGGYGLRSNNRARGNKDREIVWFSPHCLAGVNTTPSSATASPDLFAIQETS